MKLEWRWWQMRRKGRSGWSFRGKNSFAGPGAWVWETGRIRHPPLDIQVYLRMCVKWREGPGGVNLHRDVNVSWEEDTCAPLGDGGGAFIPLPGCGLYPRWRERQKVEAMTCFHEDFVKWGAQVRQFLFFFFLPISHFIQDRLRINKN